MLGTLLMGAKALTEGPIVATLILYYHLHPVFHVYECALGGIVIGYSAAAWLAYIFCAIAGGTSGFAVRLSFTFMTLVGLYYCWLITKRKSFSTLWNSLYKEIIAEKWLNLLLVLFGAYFYLVFYIHSLWKDEDGNIWSGGSMWSDLGFHLNILNSYLYGQNRNFGLFTKPVSVIFTGHGLSYPFIPDFHLVSLIASGATSLRTALLYPSVAILLSFVGLLFCFTRRFLRTNPQDRYSNGVATLAVILFFTLSGIGGYTTLRDRQWTWDNVIRHDTTQYTSSLEEIYWFHSFAHVLLPQRTATFSYPLILFVTISIYTGVTNLSMSSSQKTQLFVISGIVTGILPLIHAHSFFCLATIFLPYALLHPMRSFSMDQKTGLFLRWLQFGIPILLLALPQLPIYMDRLGSDPNNAAAISNASFLKYAPLWKHAPWIRYPGPGLWNEFMNFVLLWGRATGLFLLLSLLGTIFLSKAQMKLYLGFWLIFVIANLIQFQPWDRDNTKLFLVWTFVCCPVVCWTLYKLWKLPLVLTKILTVLIFISLILTGSMMLWRETGLWWQFMEPEDQEFGEWIAVNTDPDGVFIVNDSHINPVTNFGGKTAMINMAGWVQSHGYPNMWGRYADLRKMLSTPDQARDLYAQYNVSYVASDYRLKKDHQINYDFFRFSPDSKLIFQNGKHTVYDVSRVRPN